MNKEAMKARLRKLIRMKNGSMLGCSGVCADIAMAAHAGEDFVGVTNSEEYLWSQECAHEFNAKVPGLDYGEKSWVSTPWVMTTRRRMFCRWLLKKLEEEV